LSKKDENICQLEEGFMNNFLSFFSAISLTVLLAGCVDPVKAEKEAYGAMGAVNESHKSYAAVEIAQGNSKHGIYDPSIEYDNNTGWMTYSSIEMPKVSTYLAKSSDHGTKWNYVKTLNSAVKEKIIYNNKEILGVWRHEVSTLVHDPGDRGKEWKLFWHKYFTKKPYKAKDKLYAYGWIAYKTSTTPQGPWSEETALFGATKFTIKSYGVKIDLNSLHPDLADYLVFTEPAALYFKGLLYLSLEGSKIPRGMGAWKSRKTFLLVSHDHGKSWKYIGPLVDYRDSENLDYVVLTAASMFEEKGKVFLMVTPSGSLKKSHKNADGMFIFEFENIAEGKLKRDKKKHLLLHKFVKASEKEGGHGGQGDYDQYNTNGGIVMGHIKKRNLLKVLMKKEKNKPFNIFSTHQRVD